MKRTFTTDEKLYAFVRRHNELKAKANLPSCMEDYESGNGEGIWAIGASEEDDRKMHDDSYTGTAEVYVLNDSEYFPGIIKYRSLITVECRGDKRAVLNKTTLEELLSKVDAAANKKKCFEDMQKRRRQMFFEDIAKNRWN